MQQHRKYNAHKNINNIEYPWSSQYKHLQLLTSLVFLEDRHLIPLMAIIHNFYRFYEGEGRDPPQELEIQCSKYSLRPLLCCDDCNGDERGGDGLRPGLGDDVRGHLPGLFRVLRVSYIRARGHDADSSNNHEGVSVQYGARECGVRDCGALRAGEVSHHEAQGRVY